MLSVHATALVESLIAIQSVTPPNRLSENLSEFWGATGVGSTKDYNLPHTCVPSYFSGSITYDTRIWHFTHGTCVDVV